MPTSDECEHFTVGDWVEAARRIEALVLERTQPQHMHIFRGDHEGCEHCGARLQDVMPPPKPSDSLAQDEAAEIERLRLAASADIGRVRCDSSASVSSAIAEFAALARRLLRERDYWQAEHLTSAEVEVQQTQERDEARRLHDEHCDRPDACEPPWNPRSLAAKETSDGK